MREQAMLGRIRERARADGVRELGRQVGVVREETLSDLSGTYAEASLVIACASCCLSSAERAPSANASVKVVLPRY